MLYPPGTPNVAGWYSYVPNLRTEVMSQDCTIICVVPSWDTQRRTSVQLCSESSNRGNVPGLYKKYVLYRPGTPNVACWYSYEQVRKGYDVLTGCFDHLMPDTMFCLGEITYEVLTYDVLEER